jgi:DNA-binding XRE family transcriptional regulator
MKTAKTPRRTRAELKRLRLEADATQAQIGRAADLRVADICLYETGKLKLSDEEVARIETAVLRALAARAAKLQKLVAATAVPPQLEEVAKSA